MKESKSKFTDNRNVKDTHQKGIERIKQRDNKKEEGYDGSLDKKGSANWKRSGESLTPRRA